MILSTLSGVTEIRPTSLYLTLTGGFLNCIPLQSRF